MDDKWPLVRFRLVEEGDVWIAPKQVAAVSDTEDGGSRLSLSHGGSFDVDEPSEEVVARLWPVGSNGAYMARLYAAIRTEMGRQGMTEVKDMLSLRIPRGTARSMALGGDHAMRRVSADFARAIAIKFGIDPDSIKGAPKK